MSLLMPFFFPHKCLGLAKDTVRLLIFRLDLILNLLQELKVRYHQVATNSDVLVLAIFIQRVGATTDEKRGAEKRMRETGGQWIKKKKKRGEA